MKKKQFQEDFEFLLNSTQKKHLIDKSNDINSSGAEYIRLLIDRDILLEKLVSLNMQTNYVLSKLNNVESKLNRTKGKNRCLIIVNIIT